MGRLIRVYRAVALVWLNFCVLFLVANVIGAIVVATRKEGAGLTAMRESPPAFISEALELSYPDLEESERAELWRASGIGFRRDPLVGFREKAVTGKYVNVDPNGFRIGKDQGPWPPTDDAYNVFLLGGSTAFGYGVPDDLTISSQLQGMLPEVGGRPPKVYNFARGGFNSTMERVLFEKLLLLGPAPDLAIFLDGVNDFGQAGQEMRLPRHLTRRAEEEFRDPWLIVLRAMPFVLALRPPGWDIGLQGLAREKVEVVRVDDVEALGRVVERYLANQQAIRGVAAAEGPSVFFVWQPAPVYKYDVSYHTYRAKKFGGHERSRHGYPLMREYVDTNPPGDDFWWCADIQQNVKELLYVDRMHYNPKMSAMVARCIADGLISRGLLR